MSAKANTVVHDLPQRTPLKVVDVGELLSTEFPPRKTLLEPWLQSQNLSMLYAWRGVGKTHAALNIAYAVASGGEWLGWSAPEPSPVLYLDGEMPAVALQERISAIIAASDKEAPEGHFRILTPDMNRDRSLPDLSTIDGRDEVDEIIGDAELVVVDNLSCLASCGGRENEAESWAAISPWCLRQRTAGRSVLFVHHAGKGGQQRGTSKREDILDNVIALRHPADYQPKEGARFEIHFEKARALFGESVAAIEARLDTDERGRQSWTMRGVEAAVAAQCRELNADGWSVRDIAAELGIGKSTVQRKLRGSE